MSYRAKLCRTAAALAFLTLMVPLHAVGEPVPPEKTASILADLIRIDTTNPVGDTRPLAAYLKTLFDKAGITNEIIVAPNGKAAHFIARLRGDGSKRPLLLAAHTDVVPADRNRWTVDPFGGTVRNGFLYGRGALDNKGAVAAFATAVLQIKASGVPLARDIIFLAEADEEQGEFNTNWLAAEHWDKIDAAFVLNEGGTIRWSNGRVDQIGVSYADKLTVNLRLRVEGPAGHSSRPLPSDVSANDQLVTALARLQSYREPVVLRPETRRYLTRMARLYPGHFQSAVHTLLAAKAPAAQRKAADNVIAAGDRASGWGIEGLLRNTIVLTMLQSGIKANVIPGVAEATLNARLIPGTDLDMFLDRIRSTIANDKVSVSVLGARPDEDRAAQIRERSKIAPSSLDTDLYQAIEDSAADVWSTSTVVPTLLVASTDATPWRQRGIPVYGISPFPIEASDAAGVHGDDERVSLVAIEQGMMFINRLIANVANRDNVSKRR